MSFEINPKDEILKGLAKPIAQPYVDTFAEVFEDWQPYDLMAKTMPEHPFAPRCVVGQNIAGNLYNNFKNIMRGGARQRYGDERMLVGPFCSVSPLDSPNRYFSVSCADWVLSRIKESTIIIGGDTMSFHVIDHGNGWSLVVAQHGQILGSVWLAYIKTDSIPKTAKAAA